jgi:hypothetical protein
MQTQTSFLISPGAGSIIIDQDVAKNSIEPRRNLFLVLNVRGALHCPLQALLQQLFCDSARRQPTGQKRQKLLLIGE